MPDKLSDTHILRAAAIFARYGVLHIPAVCPRCKHCIVLRERYKDGWVTYYFTCSTGGKTHFEASLNSHGILQKVIVGRWMAFLFYLVQLNMKNRSLVAMRDETLEAFGSISNITLLRWRNMFQLSLKKVCEETDDLMVGARNEVVVIDETTIGAHADPLEDVDKLKFSKQKAPRAARTTLSINTRVLRKRTGEWSEVKRRGSRRLRYLPERST